MLKNKKLLLSHPLFFNDPEKAQAAALYATEVSCLLSE